MTALGVILIDLELVLGLWEGETKSEGRYRS